MNNYKLICQDEKRRRQVRQLGLNGLDYLEVSDDQTRLSLYFINTAPQGLTKGNFRIEGGERITGVEVTSVRYGCSEEPDPTTDVCVQLTVNKPGDYSTYRLCWVEKDAHDRPTQTRAKGADPIYAYLEFSFKAGCPNEFDCLPVTTCTPHTNADYERPEINYLAKDYASFRQLILDRLALIMPDWKERHVPDISIALVEVMAYVGDYLSYYQDAVATEAYLETSRQRISVRRHARLVDYLMHEGCNARAWLCVDNAEDFDIVLPPRTFFITGYESSQPSDSHTLKLDKWAGLPVTTHEVFHPLLNDGENIQLYADHREIFFYTWGNQQCCLPQGATRASFKGRLQGDTWKWDRLRELMSIKDKDRRPELFSKVVDGAERERKLKELFELDEKALIRLLKEEINAIRARNDPMGAAYQAEILVEFLDAHLLLLHLEEGKVLILEEIKGSQTGNRADADPSHRQAVRLTRVWQDYDPAYKQPVVEVEWHVQDALTFSLCVSTIGLPPRCERIEDVSVARGNVILVDHGRWTSQLEPLGEVPTLRTAASCTGVLDPTDVTVEVGRLIPPSLHSPMLTHRQALPKASTPACRMLTQDPDQALPQLYLAHKQPMKPGIPPEVRLNWDSRRDLLDSGPLDRHFVVEIDNDGYGHVRFGDGVNGRMPQPDDGELYAFYRVGNGPQGNVGAEMINHAVTDNYVKLQVRNPMAAQGGGAPETVESVKMFAPSAFRNKLLRAITPEDYVWLAERYPDAHEASWRTVVQRATAVVRWTGSTDEILLAIDPLLDPLRLPPEEPDQLLADLDRYIQLYRRIGHDVVVKRAHYVALDVELCVTVLPGYFRGHVKAALTETFSNRRLSNGQLGFFHPDNLTFGEGVYVSKLVTAAQTVPGVESAWVTRLQRMFELQNDTESPAIMQGVLPLGPLEIARVDNDPNRREYGRIEFRLEGGR